MVYLVRARADTNAKAELISIEALPAEAVATRVQVSDLTIVPSIGAQADAFGSEQTVIPLCSIRVCPVLVMPKIVQGPIGETAAIAWKESGWKWSGWSLRPSRFLAEAKRIKLGEHHRGRRGWERRCDGRAFAEGRSRHCARAARRAIA